MKEEILSIASDLREGSMTTSEAQAQLLRLFSVSPRIIDWKEMRNNFFNECTTQTPREESGKKVNMAPHDMFEWFKREITEYVG